MIAPADREQMKALADAIGGGPLTVQTCHYLRRGQCKAWVIGAVEAFEAAVIQWDAEPTEPEGYGQPNAMWQVLREVPGWDCVNVEEKAAEALAKLMRREIGLPCGLYGDLQFVLRQQVRRYPHLQVHLVGPDNTEFVRQHMPEELETPQEFEARLAWGATAVAIVDGKVVADATTTAWTGGYANIAVETLPEHRKRGYCTAAAALVAEAVQKAGDVPVWSAGEGNAASLRVAQKLGFEQIARKTYVLKGRVQPQS